jgi:hypothetical protein
MRLGICRTRTIRPCLFEQRQQAIYYGNIGTARSPHPKAFDDWDAPAPSEPECFDDGLPLDERDYEILFERQIRECINDNRCCEW